MKVLVIQHIPFENSGYYKDYFQSLNAEIRIVKIYEELLPAGSEFDLLLIMGGPMNIYEEDRYPWLIREKKLISEYIAGGKVVIGVCLGAQLIADSLGAKIYRANSKEIGWFPVKKTNHKILKFLPEFATVFHWHGETFDLPEGSIDFYRTTQVQNQAFIYKNRVLGLQFHLEMKPSGGIRLYNNCGDEMDDSEYVMTFEDIESGFKNYSDSNKRILKNLMNWLLSQNELI